jgi:hypothetical protein
LHRKRPIPLFPDPVREILDHPGNTEFFILEPADSNCTVNGVCNGCHGGGSGTGDPEYIINCFGPDFIDYYRLWITPPIPDSGE